MVGTFVEAWLAATLGERKGRATYYSIEVDGMTECGRSGEVAMQGIWQKTMNLRAVIAIDGAFSHIEQEWISDLGDTRWESIEEYRYGLIAKKKRGVDNA